MYKADEVKADTTAEENDEEFTFTDEDEQEEIMIPEEGDDEKEEEAKDEKKPSEVEKAERKARAVQRKYDKLVARNKELESKRTPKEEALTEEERKNKQAEKFIDDRAKQMIKEEKEEAKRLEQAKIDELAEELDEVLDADPDLTESALLDVIEKFSKKGVVLSPKQAAALLPELRAEEGPEKPRLPKSKRGTGELKVSDEAKKESEGKSFQEKISIITKDAKKRLLK
jgi:hypothetical protein